MSALARPPMRVLLLCPRLDIGGGVERFVCQLANHLARLGIDVALGSVDASRDEVGYALEPAVRVLAAGPKAPDAAGGLRLWRLLRAQWHLGRALAGLIRRERPDVVVLNGLTTACSVLLFSRRQWPRTLCCDHNHFDACSRVWQVLRRFLYPKVAALVSLTEADAAKFAALNPHTTVIYNASSLTADAPNPSSELMVLAVGRCVAQKGFDLLLQAWVGVVAACPESRLRIVGDGPLKRDWVAEAERLGIADSVEWRAPTAQIEAQYRAAAVFVLPSRFEGMPLALLEAQALGVPAVAFDCPTGPREIVAGDTGIVVPAGEVGALGQALVDLLTQPERRTRMAHAAIVRSRALFGQEAHFARWTALLREVAARGQRHG